MVLKFERMSVKKGDLNLELGNFSIGPITTD